MDIEPDHPYEILDVFTDTPLHGNPLAVFTEAEQIPSRLMQRAARELNLSETVFLLPDDPAEADARLRIFTPSTELPFAGHPTLGAAFVVAERDDSALVRLRTGAGTVPVRITREQGEIVYGEMDQPIPTVAAYPRAAELLETLGVPDTELPIEQYTNGPTHVIVTLSSPEAVADLSPDLDALQGHGALGVAVVAMTGAGTVKSRNFCPGLGVPEDPATGSAAGPLALHLARHGFSAFGKTLEITQGVEIGRPSKLFARVEGDRSEPAPITVGGSAVRVARGAFRLA
jgi:trans-2,3-dihydro-3-hydroxyanthranilate isomerase